MLLFVFDDFSFCCEIDVGLTILNINNSRALENRLTVLYVDGTIGRVLLVYVANHLDWIVHELEVAGLGLVERGLLFHAFGVVEEAV